MIMDVLVASNLCFHSFLFITLGSMMCVLGSYYYKLHPMDENVFNDFLIGKSK